MCRSPVARLAAGFSRGRRWGWGAVSVDVFYVLLSTLSFTRVVDRPAIVLPISAVGVLFLAYLGVLSLLAASRAWRHDPLDAASASGPSAAPSVRGGYLTGVVMTLLNPITLLFWFSVVPATGLIPVARPAETEIVATATRPSPSVEAEAGHLPMMAGGVFIGTLAWVVTFCALLSLVRRASARNPAARRRWLAAADAAGGLALLTFSALGAIEFLRRVLGHL